MTMTTMTMILQAVLLYVCLSVCVVVCASKVIGAVNCRKRRKSRTAFTNQQLFELERRFVRQKYVSPADRDHIARTVGMTSAQVDYFASASVCLSV